jgi:hypothetical protein
MGIQVNRDLIEGKPASGSLLPYLCGTSYSAMEVII